MTLPKYQLESAGFSIKHSDIATMLIGLMFTNANNGFVLP